MLRIAGGVVSRRASQAFLEGGARCGASWKLERSKSSVTGVSGFTESKEGQSVAKDGTIDTTAAAPKRGTNHRTFLPLDNDELRPLVTPDAYVAPSATVIGSTTMGHYSVVMNNAVVRADLAEIYIGAFSIIGDDTVLAAGSVANPSGDVSVDDYVHVGSGCVLRSCTVQRFSQIGDGSVLEENSYVGHGSIIEPKSVVAAGTEIPPGQIWGGNPAVFKGYVPKTVVYDRKKNIEASSDSIRCDYKPMYLPYSVAWLEKEKLTKKS